MNAKQLSLKRVLTHLCRLIRRRLHFISAFEVSKGTIGCIKGSLIGVYIAGSSNRGTNPFCIKHNDSSNGDT